MHDDQYTRKWSHFFNPNTVLTAGVYEGTLKIALAYILCTFLCHSVTDCITYL